MSRKKYRRVNQTEINEQISKELNIPKELVNQIILAEQETTLLYLRHNYKVVKRGYMTIIPIKKSEYEFNSYLDNNNIHNIPDQPLVRVRLGRRLIEDLKK